MLFTGHMTKPTVSKHYRYSLHMAINDVTGEMCIIGDIFREFMGHNVVSGLTLKP